VHKSELFSSDLCIFYVKNAAYFCTQQSPLIIFGGCQEALDSIFYQNQTRKLMKRLCIILVGVMFFVASCEKSGVETTKNNVQATNKEYELPFFKAEFKDGLLYFQSLKEFGQTLSFLEKNKASKVEDNFPSFKSFYSKRLSLEQAEKKPTQNLFEKFFKEVTVDGEGRVVSKIGDDFLEKILNEDAEFIIGNELHKISDGKLIKRGFTSNEKFKEVSVVKHEITNLISTSNKNARSIQGGGEYDCSGRKRVMGDLVNFNIGIYQRISVQISNQRKNTSFWSWIDPWLKHSVSSMSYNATFELGFPGFNQTYPVEGSCNNCDAINRQIDINIGIANTQVISRSGSFTINPYECSPRPYNF
jgi:hypothetical protein